MNCFTILRKMQLLEALMGRKMQLLEVLMGRKMQLLDNQPKTLSIIGNRTNVPRMLPRLVVKKIMKA